MIVNPKYIIVSLLLTDFNLSDHTNSDIYRPHTTTSMIDTSEEFYKNFWKSIIEEEFNHIQQNILP